MRRSAHTSDSPTSCRIGALACLLLATQPLVAQELPELQAWQLLPDYYHPALTLSGSSATLLYGASGEDLRHYLVHGSLPLPEGLQGLRLGASLEQRKGILWQANDLTARLGLPFLQQAGWQLLGGLEVQLLRRSYDGERALREGISDSERPTSRTEGKTFDLGLGLALAGHGLRLGVSAQRLLQRQISLGERFSTAVPRGLHAFASYNLGRETSWLLRPTAALAWSQDLGFTPEVAMAILYQGRYQLRGSWRPQALWGITAGLQLGHFLLAYSWARMKSSSLQHHEVLLSYRLPRLAPASRPAKYTSIRLL